MSPDGQPPQLAAPPGPPTAGRHPLAHARVGPRPRTPAVAVDLGAGVQFDWHEHDRHQLAWAGQGTIVLSSGEGTWVLPRSRALWLPAGVRHSVATSGASRMFSLYLDPATCPLRWARPTAVDATGLVGELITRLADHELPAEARARTEAVLWDLLEPLPVAVLTTPLPDDERARRVAEGVLADVTDERTLTAWGRDVGASARTLTRLFRAQTGLGFERWRANARLAAALPRLAAGSSVQAAALAVGYASPSAFVAAFRRELGTTPSRYFTG